MSKNLIWIDLEMTGLNPVNYTIIEIATIVTNDNLDVIAEGPNITINHSGDILDNMEEWSQTHHDASGLTERAKSSKYNLQQAENETLDFLSSFCKPGESPLCGNTIWQDRRFLIQYMPELETFFHYRNIDVSSIKELTNRWFPALPQYEKKNDHLALSDIKESINELKYYREFVFRDNQ